MSVVEAVLAAADAATAADTENFILGKVLMLMLMLMVRLLILKCYFGKGDKVSVRGVIR